MTVDGNALRERLRLMDAAPDLYEACREALAYIMGMVDPEDDVPRVAKVIDAALAKAEGRD